MEGSKKLTAGTGNDPKILEIKTRSARAVSLHSRGSSPQELLSLES
jgi:hypothetical protein